MRLSVIIPCRNEEAHLESCLDSVLASTWPREELEILIVDGRSTDCTRIVADRVASVHPNVHVLDNPRRTAPAAMNIGLAKASGDVIARLDAHVRYPPDYLQRLVARLEESGADNVGGRVETLPAARTVTARAIARVLAHPFGVGNAQFRLSAGASAAPRWVDTVPFGCFHRSLFDRIGGFDEELVRNQDDELNARIIRGGGRVLLDPGIVAHYIARATYRQLSRMYYQYGLFKPLAARKAGAVLTLRQLVPATLLTTLGVLAALSPWSPIARVAGLGLVALYATGAVIAAFGAREDGARGLLARATAFGVLHASYGWGYLRGLDRLVSSRAPMPDAAALPLSR